MAQRSGTSFFTPFVGLEPLLDVVEQLGIVFTHPVFHHAEIESAVFLIVKRIGYTVVVEFEAG